MTDNVINLRGDLAPPSTDFEREAVEVLLANIRSFRADTGLEPQSLTTILIGQDDQKQKMGHRVGWFNTGNDGMRLRFAYGAAILSEQAIRACDCG